MLFSYIVSSFYILTFAAYWIYSFLRKSQTYTKQGPQVGNIISLCLFCLLLALVFVSIIYFCWLRYKLRLSRNQIVSKTMGHSNRGFIALMALDIVLWVVVYSFTAYEQIQHVQDFIKLHSLFVIMTLYVGSFNGLRWFGLKRGWEIAFLALIVLMSGCMQFLDFYYSQSVQRRRNSMSSSSQYIRPQFNHYISGPLIIIFQFIYLTLSENRLVQKITCKCIQLWSLVIFRRRIQQLFDDALPKQFFSFDFIWAIALCLIVFVILIKDIYEFICWCIKKIKQKKYKKQIQKFRHKIRNYLHTFSKMNQSELRIHIYEDCAICLQTTQNQLQIVQLECNHSFHYNCIFQWFGKQTTCPVCRSFHSVNT